MKMLECRGKGSWDSENGMLSSHMPGNPDFRAIGSYVLSNPNSNSYRRDTTVRQSSELNPGQCPSNARACMTQSFITFSTISDESPRRRRIRPLLPVIFLQLILYQRLTHLVDGRLTSSSLHSPKGRSQSALIISGTSTYVLVPMYGTYISISMTIYLFNISISNFTCLTTPFPTFKQNKKKSKAELETATLGFLIL